MGEVNKTMFIMKYIFRFLHMLSFAILFGFTSYDLFLNTKVNKDEYLISKQKTLNILFFVIVMISGLVNMILLVKEKKYEKDTPYNIWKISLMIKFFLTLLITPILESLISIGVQTQTEIDSYAVPIKFTIMLIFILGSPFLRFYREYYLTSGLDSYIK